MKLFLRSFTFVFISYYAAMYLIGGLYSDTQSQLLAVIALSLLFLFIRPILKLLSLPESGPGYFIMNFLLTFLLIYVLTLLLPDISFVSSSTPRLIILGFMLPSKHLPALQAGALTILVYCAVSTYLGALCTCKKN